MLVKWLNAVRCFILLAEPHNSLSNWLDYDMPSDVGHGKKVVIKTVETRDGEVRHLLDTYSVSERLCIVMSLYLYMWQWSRSFFWYLFCTSSIILFPIQVVKESRKEKDTPRDSKESNWDVKEVRIQECAGWSVT